MRLRQSARTHRTPKALGAKCVQDAVPHFAQAFGVRTACPPVCGRPRVAFVSPLSLQPDWMPGIKPARWPINGLPAGRLFAGVTIVWRRVESQPGNHSKRVALARVDRDPLARAALAVAAKLG